MSDPRSVNRMVEVDRELRKHWIWDRELPNKSQMDRKGRCLICELIHPSSSRQWRKCKRRGEQKMIEERHDGYEFISRQNHGSASKKL